MDLSVIGTISPIAAIGGGAPPMLGDEEVSVMFELWKKKWNVSQLASALGHDRKTVRKWVRRWDAGFASTSPHEALALEGKRLGRPPCVVSSVDPEWLKERLATHGGNADVVRQDLEAKTGQSVSLRSVQRALQGFRQDLRAQDLATLRFETPPSHQLQIDFGTKTMLINGQKSRVHVCVLTLAWSRKIFVRAWQAERQAHWFTTLEEAFLAFGGVPRELLVDNAKALVKHNDGNGGVEFNAEFLAFCEHWGVRPRACRPYRARTKGKDESAVKYVKRNALAGREFSSWEDLAEHLERWMRDVADTRIHGTTRVQPCVRFAEEQKALAPLRGQPRYLRRRILKRRVQNDCVVAYGGNVYSVPWKLIGREVELVAEGLQLFVWDNGKTVAHHALAADRSGARVIDSQHLRGLIDLQRKSAASDDAQVSDTVRPGYSALLRPLEEYDALCAGGWA